jgi:predicted glycogen debranching enzyme
MIRFGQDVCGDLDAALRREWLETNGLGGFASSTIVGLNTRRYHGLLVAAIKPPVDRYVLLSKLEETLLLDGRAFDLSANRYPSVVHPRGFRYLKQFRLDPFPIFTYEIDGVEIEKTVFMVQGENSTIVQYQLGNKTGSKLLSQKIELELRPLIAFRDYHSTTHENGALNSTVESAPGLASITPYPGLPSLHLAHNAGQLGSGSNWYRDFEYDAERERGLDFVEDLFNPCVLRFDLCPESAAAVIASTERRDAAKVDEYLQAEISRRRSNVMRTPVEDDFVKALTAAADQFIVARGEQKTVIAGYHWFSDWGRDTMIALPGLTLPLKRYDLAQSILRAFSQYVDRGMLPNHFPDAGEILNTILSTLLFGSSRPYEHTLPIAATWNLFATISTAFSPTSSPGMCEGTRFGIKVDSDGLLSSGEPGVALTWMDAKVGDWVVTPRRGKPVEIQALWYNALRVLEDVARRLEDAGGRKRYGAMAALTKRSFNRLFWDKKNECLYDVVNGGPPDSSIRPNQIIAVSLPHTMLSPGRAKHVVEIAQEHLLTPYGLRSVAPSDPQYRGRYTGDSASRDAAYHQGTVWPWLMGPFLTAYIKVHGGGEPARRQAQSWLSAFKEHSTDSGLGQVSEIFDGDAPHRPVGCIAQAWSVAELLRATVEDIYGVRPGQKNPAKICAAGSRNCVS